MSATIDTQAQRSMSVLRRVAHFDWGAGRFTVDTTASLAATLAPLFERTRTPARIVSYDFDHLRSTGRIGPDTALKAIDDHLPKPSFNSTDLDMLVTALRLDEDFHAAIPLYDPEFPGFRMAELRVTGTEQVASGSRSRRVWVLAVAVVSKPTMFYRVDTTTHRMLQKDFGDPAATSFRLQATDGP
ncbi:MAG: hypothetical protein ABJE47_06930 [bacterium]